MKGVTENRATAAVGVQVETEEGGTAIGPETKAEAGAGVRGEGGIEAIAGAVVRATITAVEAVGREGAAQEGEAGTDGAGAEATAEIGEAGAAALLTIEAAAEAAVEIEGAGAKAKTEGEEQDRAKGQPPRRKTSMKLRRRLPTPHARSRLLCHLQRILLSAALRRLHRLPQYLYQARFRKPARRIHMGDISILSLQSR